MHKILGVGLSLAPSPARTAFARHAAEITTARLVAVSLHLAVSALGVGVEEYDAVLERLLGELISLVKIM